MKDALLQWLSNPSLGTIVGIIGIVIAVATYFLSRSVYRLSVHKTTKELIGPSDSLLPSQVEVLYEGEIVSKLSSTNFVIWNSGNKVISKGSLETIDPLRIDVASDARILRHEIKIINNPTCNFSVKPDESGLSLTLHFDFLEKNDGLHLQILHTGSDSDIDIAGKIIGVKTPNNTFRSIFNSVVAQTKISIITPLTIMVAFVFFSSILAITFLFPDTIESMNKQSAESGLWPLRTALSINLVPLLLMFFLIRRIYPASLKEQNHKKNKNES